MQACGGVGVRRVRLCARSRSTRRFCDIKQRMADNNDILFEVETPFGFRVRVTVEYWQLIVTIKHPVMFGREADVQEVL